MSTAICSSTRRRSSSGRPRFADSAPIPPRCRCPAASIKDSRSAFAAANKMKPRDPRMLAAVAMAAACAAAVLVRAQEGRLPDASTLQQMAARFAPTEITADLSRLADRDRSVLAKLVEASKIVDALFLRQVWAGNEAMLLDLIRDDSPAGRARLDRKST